MRLGGVQAEKRQGAGETRCGCAELPGSLLKFSGGCTSYLNPRPLTRRVTQKDWDGYWRQVIFLGQHPRCSTKSTEFRQSRTACKHAFSEALTQKIRIDCGCVCGAIHAHDFRPTALHRVASDASSLSRFSDHRAEKLSPPNLYRHSPFHTYKGVVLSEAAEHPLHMRCPPHL